MHSIKGLSQRDFREALSKKLHYHINDDNNFKGCYNNGRKGAFTRTRCLPFNQLIVSIFRFGKGAIQRELDSFFKDVYNEDYSIRKITKSGFSQARSNLDPRVFLELNNYINESFYKNAPYLTYHGRRLLSVDGSYLNLPNHPSIIKEFGSRLVGGNANFAKSFCLLSVLYDVANGVVVDVQSEHMDGSECDLLPGHLHKVNKGDILMLDRGYPSRILFAALQSKNIHFICRMRSNWLCVEELLDSSRREMIVNFELTEKEYALYSQQYPAIKRSVKCRLVKIELPDGTTQVLCTSLRKSKRYKVKELGELYHLRWNIEEGFKLFKKRVHVEAFSGKTAIAIRQDIYAKMMMLSLSAVFCCQLHPKIIKIPNQRNKKRRRRQRQLNKTYAYWAARGIIIGLLLKKSIQCALSAFDREVSLNTESVRPGRSKERKKLHQKIYYPAYRDL